MPNTFEPPHFPHHLKRSNSLQQHLLYRELHAGYDPYSTRRMYKFVAPNLTITNIDKPDSFLRKFSPDGKYLLATSHDMHSLEVYEFLGPAAFADSRHLYGDDVQAHLCFRHFFRLKHSIRLSSSKVINRESGLFTMDNEHFIIGASAPANEVAHSFTSPMCRSDYAFKDLENYTLYLINFSSGKKCDSINFTLDKLMLAHNQSIWLFHHTLAVLSYFHDTIHIYEVRAGQFVKEKSIGRFATKEDVATFTRVPEYRRQYWRRTKDEMYTCIQQKLLTYLLVDRRDDKLKMRCYFSLDDILTLTTWRMQLLSEEVLLLKLVTPQVLNSISKTPDAPSMFPCMFIVYNHVDGKIISVMDNINGDFLNLFERYADFFINPTAAGPTPNYLATISNNYYSYYRHCKYKAIMRSGKNGGEVEANKRLLGILPFHCQCFTPSPYIDQTLFDYDDKLVSLFERPRGVGDCHIAFKDRLSGEYVFSITLGMPGHEVTTRGVKKLTAIIFHPFDPFAISVQRVDSEYMINMHMYEDPAYSKSLDLLH